MKSQFYESKPQAILLRKLGKTYTEIRIILKVPIPKSTLSCWCKNIELTEEHKKRIRQIIAKNTEKSRPIALKANKLKRQRYVQSIKERLKSLKETIKNKDVAKIALAMLYLGEGGKTTHGSIVFGNSDPTIIEIFLNLLRYCYILDESKFRCTLQCRADQDTQGLEKFWSEKTNISLSQFYKARIDPRTIGKPSKKPDYKGVCRIDYFSADIFMELKQVVEVIY